MIHRTFSATTCLITIYAICFAIGAASHAVDFAMRGWQAYAAAPLGFELFWSSLLVLDILVVTLLVTHYRRAGVVLAVGIMVMDVLINTYASMTLEGVMVWKIVLQATFLGFLIGSVGFLDIWRVNGDEN